MQSELTGFADVLLLQTRDGFRFCRIARKFCGWIETPPRLAVQAVTHIHGRSPVSEDVQNGAFSLMESWLSLPDNPQQCITFTTAAKTTAHT